LARITYSELATSSELLLRAKKMADVTWYLTEHPIALRTCIRYLHGAELRLRRHFRQPQTFNQKRRSFKQLLRKPK
jgi:hypothetical protein